MTPEQMNALVAELERPEYSGLNEQQAYAQLHEPQTIRSTRTQPKPLTVTASLGGLSAESAAKLAVNPNVCDLRDKIQSQDRDGVGLWVQFFALAGEITQQEAGAMMGQLGSTEVSDVDVVTAPRIGKAFVGVEGMPNMIEPADFATAFTAATGGE